MISLVKALRSFDSATFRDNLNTNIDNSTKNTRPMIPNDIKGLMGKNI
jgi:hypothetical protein